MDSLTGSSNNSVNWAGNLDFTRELQNGQMTVRGTGKSSGEPLSGSIKIDFADLGTSYQSSSDITAMGKQAQVFYEETVLATDNGMSGSSHSSAIA